MGRGRHPKPIATHKQEKEKLYGDLAERAEIEPEPIQIKKIVPPRYLSKNQKKEWKKFASILRDLSLFHNANSQFLEMLAINVDMYKQCIENIETMGMTELTEKKECIINPYLKIKSKCEEKIIKILSELGLSSTALAKLGSIMVDAKKKKSKFEELLD